MPDWLILSGVQTGSGVTSTFLAPVDAAIALLSNKSRQTLFEKRFVTSPPDSFVKEALDAVLGLDSEEKDRMMRNLNITPDSTDIDLLPQLIENLVRNINPPHHTVLSEYEGNIESVFDLSSGLRPFDPTDAEAASALEEMEAALTAVKQQVVIAPGTAVAFNNRRVVHGRGAIGPEVSPGSRRWLQRLYVMNLERVVKNTMGKPRTLQVTNGMVGVSTAGLPSPRILKLL